MVIKRNELNMSMEKKKASPNGYEYGYPYGQPLFLVKLPYLLMRK